MPNRRTIRAAAKKEDRILAFLTPVKIEAAKEDGGTPRFEMEAYTGGELELENFDLPVIVDLAGAKFHQSVKANLNHDRKRIVGHVSEKSNDGKSVRLGGYVSGGGEAATEVLTAHRNGYPWEASIQANRLKIEMLPRGKTVTVNAQQVAGPKYIARQSTIYAVAFCDQGADGNTSITIAASAASQGETKMDPEIKAWAEKMGIDVDNLSDDQIATIEANYAGRTVTKKARAKASDVIAQAREEDERRQRMADICAQAIADNPGRDGDFISKLELLTEQAIEAGWTSDKFDTEVLRATRPQAHTPFRGRRDERMNNKVIEAAICVAGRLEDVEKKFNEPTLEAAHQHFPNGVGLKQLFLICAEANGHRSNHASDVTLDVQRAAFGMTGRQIQASPGTFSTLSIPTIISNTANKYLMEGWNAVDDTAMRIAAIRSVRNFQEITTISLTGDLLFEKIGPAGEIQHGSLGEKTYGNKADTYAKMLAITRQDIINDDIGALTAVPRRLGRGSKLKLNQIFWTEFLNPTTANFFHANNNNVNTGVADMTTAGLAATELIFMNQTDPDGQPLGITPAILLVPTALKTAANVLMTSDRMLGSSGPDGNPWRGRFRVESSPYLHNTAYTGYSAAAWYMLANPSDLPLIEIVALNGRVEPVVETADAEFNVLGVQMRGYSDIGVRVQEYRAGVRADGGSS